MNLITISGYIVSYIYNIANVISVIKYRVSSNGQSFQKDTAFFQENQTVTRVGKLTRSGQYL